MWRVNPLLLRGHETLNTARPQPSTATFRRPHPRVPLHEIWAYMHRQGCAPRRVRGHITGPAAPPRPPPDLGAAGKSTQRSRARGFEGRDGVGVVGEAATATYSLPLPFRRPPPRSARVIAQRADYKSRLQALF